MFKFDLKDKENTWIPNRDNMVLDITLHFTSWSTYNHDFGHSQISYCCWFLEARSSWLAQEKWMNNINVQTLIQIHFMDH